MTFKPQTFQTSNIQTFQTILMDKFPQTDPWCIVEENFNVKNQLDSETVFSLGNGRIVQRGNLEEYYSGDTIQGSYIAGNFKPVNGISLKSDFPEASTNHDIVNAPSWINIIVRLNEEKLDLAVWEIINFKRVLNLKDCMLERTFEAISLKGHHISVSVKRFLSMAETEVAAISYSVKSLNFVGRISFMPVIDGDLSEYYSSDIEPIWNVLQSKTQQEVAHLWTQTRHTNFHVCTALAYDLYKNNEHVHIIPTKIEKEKIAGFSTGIDVKSGDTLCLNKYVAILNSLNHPLKELTVKACELALMTKHKGWNKLYEEHSLICKNKWQNSGIDLERNHSDVQDNLLSLFLSYQDVENKVEL